MLSEVVDLKATHSISSLNQRSFDEIFILNGVVRAYLIDEEGNDRTSAFYFNGSFMSTNALRTLKKLSIYNYQALSDTKLLIFNSKKLKDFFSKTTILNSLGFKIKELEKERLWKRDSMLLQVNSAERFKKLVEHYPKIETQVSHKYIASYLGVTPVSFSRIERI